MAQIITMRLPFMNKSLASRQLMNHRRQLQFRNNVDQLRCNVAMDTRGNGGQTQHRMASTYLLHTRMSSIMSACSQLRPSMSTEAFVRGVGTTSSNGDDGMQNGKSGNQELAEPFSKSSINTRKMRPLVSQYTDLAAVTSVSRHRSNLMLCSMGKGIKQRTTISQI
ncbi:hypothetical protein EB796_023660 [Bugula neritina]|uniref:Uncharacterized protein n=1 Tax=Bugula neritina TaxID=10212 RepID=A0A7J7IWX7_BUGNE|nr:hypothetical protein EB796_023660 [Bugula neritina]